MTRRGRLFGLVGAMAVMAALAVSAPSVWADAPSAYGWWYEANAGLPVPPPAPPSTPPDGLYVANGVSGPTAIAALTVPVPSGAAMGPLVLHVAGSPLMTQPPVACPLRAPFKPTQGGTWTDRPTYDCAQAQKVGSVDSAKTTVSFDASPFLRDGAVGVVILAGGPTDQVAFVRPGPDTLATSNVPGVVPAADVSSPPPADGSSARVAGPAFSAVPSVDTGAASLPPAVTGPAASEGLPATAASGGGATAGAGGTFSQAGAVGSPPSGWRSRVGGVLGVIAVLLALVAWSEGYGLLGGRVRSLASPLGSADSVKAPRRGIIRRPGRRPPA